MHHKINLNYVRSREEKSVNLKSYKSTRHFRYPRLMEGLKM